MRLTLISETFWPQTNGVSNVLGRLVDYARARGHQVQLIIPRYRERQGNPDEVGVFSMPFPLYPEVRVPLLIPGRVWRRVVAFQPELIHIATEATLGLALLLKARKSAFPVVSSYHTNFSQYVRHYYGGFLEGRIWQYLRWFHNQCLRTYAPSQMTLEELTHRGFRNVEIFSRGADTRLFNPRRRSPALRQQLGLKEGDVLAAYVGRLAKEKNLPQLLRAFSRLRERASGVYLLLVGDGPIRGELERSKPPGVLCVGYKRGEELATHFASADFFWFPSLTETFGNVVLEALASGLPVVGFRAGGVPHSVHDGDNGLLAEPGDEEAFLRHAETLCREPALRRRMSEAAWTYAQSQTWEHIFERLFESYGRVLRGEPAGG